LVFVYKGRQGGEDGWHGDGRLARR
jgi:hypothetical protein